MSFALDFNNGNSNSWVDLGNSTVTSSIGDFTAEAWVNPRTVSGYDSIIAIGTNGDEFLFCLYNGKVGLYSSVVGSKITAVTVAVNTWTHITFVREGSNYFVYRDGILAESGAWNSNKISISGVLRAIGSDKGGEYFDGKIADIRLWNYARSQILIAANKDSYLTGNEDGLIGNWKFDEGTGTTAVDSTGKTNGTISGAVWTVDGHISDERKLNLYAGTGGRSGQKVYTAPNGVIVTSSAPTYSNGTYYYMEYLFDGMSDSDANHYWLTGSSGTQTLVFDFGAIQSLYDVTRLRVAPRIRTDASSNYRIFGSKDNVNWTLVSDWVTTTNSSPAFGTFYEHLLNDHYRYIKFELTQNGSWGVGLNEIEVYVGASGSAILGSAYVGRRNNLKSVANGNYLSVASNANLNFSKNNQFTMEFWAKKTAEGASNPRAIPFSKGTTYIDLNNGGKVFFSAYIVGGQRTWTSERKAKAIGEWGHYALTFNGSTVRGYVDGEQVLEAAYAGSATNNDVMNLFRFYNGNYNLVGNMAEIRLWNVARTQSQIRDLMYTTADAVDDSLVFYLKTYNADMYGQYRDSSMYANAISAVGTISVDTDYSLPFSYGGKDTADITSAIQVTQAVDFEDKFRNRTMIRTTNGASAWMKMNPVIPLSGDYTIEVLTTFPYNNEENSNWHTLVRGSSYNHVVIVQSGTGMLGVYDNVGGAAFRSSGFNVYDLKPGIYRLTAVGVQARNATDFYINGRYVGTAPFKSNDNIYSVGAYQDGTQRWGELADFRVWNKARTADEIAADMFSTLVGDEPSLVSYFPMDEGTGTTLTDRVAGGRTLAFQGSVRWIKAGLETYSIGQVEMKYKRVVYVDSMNGDDTANGLRANPFKTLLAAMDYLNNNGFRENVAVVLADGVYDWTPFTMGTSSDVPAKYQGMTVSFIADTLGKVQFTSTRGAELKVTENSTAYRIRLMFYGIVFKVITGDLIHLGGDDWGNYYFNCAFDGLAIGGWSGNNANTRIFVYNSVFYNCSALSYRIANPIAGISQDSVSNSWFYEPAINGIQQNNWLNIELGENYRPIDPAVPTNVGVYGGTFAWEITDSSDLQSSLPVRQRIQADTPSYLGIMSNIPVSLDEYGRYVEKEKRDFEVGLTYNVESEQYSGREERNGGNLVLKKYPTLYEDFSRDLSLFTEIWNSTATVWTQNTVSKVLSASATPANTESWFMFKDLYMKDFDIEVEISTAGDGGVLFGAYDSGNSYLVQPTTGNYIRLYRDWGGTYTNIASASTTAFAGGAWAKVRIVNVERNIKVYVNDTLLINYDDLKYVNAFNDRSRIGFRHYTNAVSFRKLKINGGELFSESATQDDIVGWKYSPYISIESIANIIGNTVEWSSYEPAGTSIEVQARVSRDGGINWGAWEQVSNRGAIADLPYGDSSYLRVQFKTIFRSNTPYLTPVLHDFVFKVDDEPTSTSRVYYEGTAAEFKATGTMAQAEVYSDTGLTIDNAASPEANNVPGWSGTWYVDGTTGVWENEIYDAVNFNNYSFKGATTNMQAKFLGWFTPPVTEAYTFYLYSDDGCNLLLDDVLVMNYPSYSTAWHKWTTPVLEAGQKYKIEINHNQVSSTHYIQFQIDSASVVRQYPSGSNGMITAYGVMTDKAYRYLPAQEFDSCEIVGAKFEVDAVKNTEGLMFPTGRTASVKVAGGASMLSDEVTIEFIVKPMNNNNVIVLSSSTGLTFYIIWNDQVAYFDYPNNSGSGRISFTYPWVYYDKQHRVTYVASKSKGYVAVYIDGVKMAEAIGKTLGNVNGAGDLYFGQHYDGNYKLYGSMKDVRIWNYVRSEEEIRANFGWDADLSSQSGLVARWQMDETSGTVVHDSIGGIDGFFIGTGHVWGATDAYVETSIDGGLTWARTNDDGTTAIGDGVYRIQARQILTRPNLKNHTTRPLLRSVRTELTLLPYNDIGGTVKVRAAETEDLSSSIDVYRTSLLPSSVNVKFSDSSDMTGRIAFKAKTRMRSIIEINSPQKDRLYISPVKDAFVRESVPILNYGTEASMQVGYNEARAERLRSLIEFDLTQLIDFADTIVIDKAELKLHYSSNSGVAFNLFNVEGEWTERGVTWANAPTVGSAVQSDSFTDDVANRTFVFDLTTLVTQLRELKQTSLDLYIKAVDETTRSFTIFTNEMGGEYVPQLEITYYDTVIKSFGRAERDSRIIVMYRGNKDLKSKITVKKIPVDLDLPSEIYVRRGDFKIGTITVSRPDMQGKLKARRSDYREFDGSITVRVKEFNDFTGGVITVNKKNLPSSLFIKYRKDIPSELAIRVSDYNDLFDWFTVSAPSRPAKVYVRHYFDFPGSINLRQHEKTEIPSQITLSFPNIEGSLYIRFGKDLSGKLRVRRADDKDIKVSIVVSRPNMKGSISVNPYVLLPSSVEVRRGDDSEIGGQVTPSFPNLLSKVEVLNRGDLSGVIAVAIPDDLTSSVYILNRKDIQSSFEVVNASRLPSSIIVLSGNLASRIIVPINGLTEITGSIIARVKWASNLDSFIDVKQVSDVPSWLEVRGFEHGDIPSTITARQLVDGDLPSSIDVYKLDLLDSLIAVRQSTTDDMESGIAVPNNLDTPSELYIRPYHDLPSTILPVIRGNADTESSIFVIVKATDDVPSSIDVTKRGYRDILGTIGVPHSNKMTGVTDVIPATIIKKDYTVVKDAFIREDVPKLNYGMDESFMVGTYGGAKLRSLMTFDLSGLNVYLDIQTIKLKLYLSINGINAAKQLKLVDASGDWEETGVTWENSPLIGFDTEIGNYTVNYAEGCLEFDVKDYILDKLNSGKGLLNWYLLAGDETEATYAQFFSKEFGEAVVPKIEVAYYTGSCREVFSDHMLTNNWNDQGSVSNSWWSYGSSYWTYTATHKNTWAYLPEGNYTIETLYTANGWNYNELFLGLMSIRYYYYDYNRRSYVRIRDGAGWKYIDVDVLGNNNWKLTYDQFGYYELFKNGALVSSGTVAIPAEFTTNIWQKVDDSSVSIDYIRIKECLGSPVDDGKVWSNGRAEVDSRIVVPANKDIPSKLMVHTFSGGFDTPSSVYVNRGYEHIGTITVSKPDLPSTIGIQTSSWRSLPSSMTVRNASFDEIGGAIIVNVKEIPSMVFVAYNKDIPSSMTVKTIENSDFTCWITVIRENLYSKIHVVYSNYVDSTITVRRLDDTDTLSSINVKQVSDIDGTIQPRIHRDMDSVVNIVYGGDSSTDGRIRVNPVYLPAKLYVPYRSDLSGTLTVEVGEYDEVKGTIAVSRPDLPVQFKILERYDLPSEIEVSAGDWNDLPSVITVNKPDLPSELGVSIFSEIEGTVDVMPFGHKLPSRIFVVGASVVPGSIYANSGNLAGQIGVAGYYHSELPSSMTVRERFKDDLPTTLEVHVFDDLLSSILPNVWGSGDLNASVQVVIHGDTDLPSIIIPKLVSEISSRLAVKAQNRVRATIEIHPARVSDILSMIQLELRTQLPSLIYVQHDEADDMKSTVEVITKGQLEVEGSIQIVSGGDRDLSSVLRVSSPNKMTGKVFIIAVGDADLPSSIEVHEVSQIPSKIAVRRMDWDDIEFAIDVKQVSDLPSSIVVRQTDDDDFKSTIAVRRTDWSDLTSEVYVLHHSDISLSISVWRYNTLPSSIYVLYRYDLTSSIDVVAEYGYCFIM